MRKHLFLTNLLWIAMAGCLMTACTNDQIPAEGFCTVLPEPAAASIEPADCGLANGSITLTDLGDGTEYSIDGGAFSAALLFEGLAPGSYTITARTGDGCEGSTDISVPVSGGLQVSLQVADAGCESTDGSIEVNATGTAGTLSYQLSGGDFQSSNVFSGLAAGQYEVVVRDDTGCEIILSAELESGTTLSGSINPIIQQNCAISGCHNGSQSPDMRTLNGIRNAAERIRSRTTSRTMPPGARTISDAQIEAIACWVEDGAQNN